MRLCSRAPCVTSQITGLTYVGEELVVTHAMWIGDVWVADLR